MHACEADSCMLGKGGAVGEKRFGQASTGGSLGEEFRWAVAWIWRNADCLADELLSPSNFRRPVVYAHRRTCRTDRKRLCFYFGTDCRRCRETICCGWHWWRRCHFSAMAAGQSADDGHGEVFHRLLSFCEEFVFGLWFGLCATRRQPSWWRCPRGCCGGGLVARWGSCLRAGRVADGSARWRSFVHSLLDLQEEDARGCRELPAWPMHGGAERGESSSDVGDVSGFDRLPPECALSGWRARSFHFFAFCSRFGNVFARRGTRQPSFPSSLWCDYRLPEGDAVWNGHRSQFWVAGSYSEVTRGVGHREQTCAVVCVSRHWGRNCWCDCCLL